MTDQPTERHDSQGSGAQGSGDSPEGYQPPQFVPSQGSSVPPPPLYDQNPYGAGQYSPPGDQYGAPYSQPPSPYGQQSPYGQPAYGQAYYGMPAEPKGLSIASMVCGIASVLLGWFMIPQIAAIITGHLALRREPTGKGMSITGLVLGYLCLLGYGAFWLFLIIGLSLYSTSGYRY
ncbi:MAG TPA: DUF4190 domain-containing protein [Arthrobacter sp.]